MMPRNKALLSLLRSLLLFILWITARLLNVGLARDIRREEEAARLAYESRCAMRLMLV
ncbi:hypothetical protein KCP76_13110 [Salmonella enterica subsp. enterica serovar Weltevreden]|nr:hypothetical protein KCP76_13110 [Salmonella enterica subsp. enterica serovar Weltevreden]